MESPECGSRSSTPVSMELSAIEVLSQRSSDYSSLFDSVVTADDETLDSLLQEVQSADGNVDKIRGLLDAHRDFLSHIHSQYHRHEARGAQKQTGKPTKSSGGPTTTRRRRLSGTRNYQQFDSSDSNFTPTSPGTSGAYVARQNDVTLDSKRAAISSLLQRATMGQSNAKDEMLDMLDPMMDMARRLQATRVQLESPEVSLRSSVKSDGDTLRSSMRSSTNSNRIDPPTIDLDSVDDSRAEDVYREESNPYTEQSEAGIDNGGESDSSSLWVDNQTYWRRRSGHTESEYTEYSVMPTEYSDGITPSATSDDFYHVSYSRRPSNQHTYSLEEIDDDSDEDDSLGSPCDLSEEAASDGEFDTYEPKRDGDRTLHEKQSDDDGCDLSNASFVRELSPSSGHDMKPNRRRGHCQSDPDGIKHESSSHRRSEMSLLGRRLSDPATYQAASRRKNLPALHDEVSSFKVQAESIAKRPSGSSSKTPSFSGGPRKNRRYVQQDAPEESICSKQDNRVQDNSYDRGTSDLNLDGARSPFKERKDRRVRKPHLKTSSTFKEQKDSSWHSERGTGPLREGGKSSTTKHKGKQRHDPAVSAATEDDCVTRQASIQTVKRRGRSRPSKPSKIRGSTAAAQGKSRQPSNSSGRSSSLEKKQRASVRERPKSSRSRSDTRSRSRGDSLGRRPGISRRSSSRSLRSNHEDSFRNSIGSISRESSFRERSGRSLDRGSSFRNSKRSLSRQSSRRSVSKDSRQSRKDTAKKTKKAAKEKRSLLSSILGLTSKAKASSAVQHTLSKSNVDVMDKSLRSSVRSNSSAISSIDQQSRRSHVSRKSARSTKSLKSMRSAKSSKSTRSVKSCAADVAVRLRRKMGDKKAKAEKTVDRRDSFARESSWKSGTSSHSSARSSAIGGRNIAASSSFGDLSSCSAGSYYSEGGGHSSSTRDNVGSMSVAEAVRALNENTARKRVTDKISSAAKVLRGRVSKWG